MNSREAINQLCISSPPHYSYEGTQKLGEGVVRSAVGVALGVAAYKLYDAIGADSQVLAGLVAVPAAFYSLREGARGIGAALTGGLMLGSPALPREEAGAVYVAGGFTKRQSLVDRLLGVRVHPIDSIDDFTNDGYVLLNGVRVRETSTRDEQQYNRFEPELPRSHYQTTAKGEFKGAQLKIVHETTRRWEASKLRRFMEEYKEDELLVLGPYFEGQIESVLLIPAL